MRKKLFLISMVLYNILTFIFIGGVFYYIFHKSLQALLIAILSQMLIVTIFLYKNRTLYNSIAIDPIDFDTCNSYQKTIINEISRILKKEKIEPKVYHAFGYILGMSKLGLIIDFDMSSDYMTDFGFDRSVFAGIMYHEIGHYKSGIVMINNKILQIIRDFSLVRVISIIIERKYLYQFSLQYKNDHNTLKFKFWYLLNIAIDFCSFVYTFFLRNDEYYANNYAVKNESTGGLYLRYMTLHNLGGRTQDLKHPSIKKQLSKMLKKDKNKHLYKYKGIYLFGDSLVYIKNKKNLDLIKLMCEESDKYAIYDFVETTFYEEQKDDGLEFAIDLYKMSAQQGHKNSQKQLVMLLGNDCLSLEFSGKSLIDEINILKAYNDLIIDNSDNNALSLLESLSIDMNDYASRSLVYLIAEDYVNSKNYMDAVNLIEETLLDIRDIYDDYPILKNLAIYKKYINEDIELAYDALITHARNSGSLRASKIYYSILENYYIDFDQRKHCASEYLSLLIGGDKIYDFKGFVVLLYKYKLLSNIESLEKLLMSNNGKSEQFSVYLKEFINQKIIYLYELNDYQGILSIINKYKININDYSSKTLSCIGYAYYNLKEYENAYFMYDQLNVNSSEYPYALYVKAFMLYHGQGLKEDKTKAMEMFRESYKLGNQNSKDFIVEHSNVNFFI